MKKDFSPEEKLLRLIKNAAKKDTDRDKPEIRNAAPQTAVSFAPFSFKMRNFSTRRVNPVLIAVLVCLCLYFAIDLVRNPYYKEEEAIKSLAEKEDMAAKEKSVSPIEPYSYYSAGTDSRNIFSAQEEEGMAVVLSGPSMEEISSNLSLIGIIAGDKPQAIVEDKKAGKSYFLYKGGIIGQAKVIEISEDKVIMEYKGQTFELIL